MPVRFWQILPLFLAAAALPGCMAVGPYATVKLIEGFEQATGRLLDGRPLPTSTPPSAGDPADSNGVDGPGTPVAAPNEAATPAPAAEASGIITLGMFNQLQAGMTYMQIVEVLGRQGQLLPNSRTKVYVWHNPNGSFVRLVFSADRMADKEQQRLS